MGFRVRRLGVRRGMWMAGCLSAGMEDEVMLNDATADGMADDDGDINFFKENSKL